MLSVELKKNSKGFFLNVVVVCGIAGAAGTTKTVPAPEHQISGNTIYTHLFVPWAGSLNGSLAFTLTYILVLFGAMYLLYRRRIIIKI